MNSCSMAVSPSVQFGCEVPLVAGGQLATDGVALVGRAAGASEWTTRGPMTAAIHSPEINLARKAASATFARPSTVRRLELEARAEKGLTVASRRLNVVAGDVARLFNARKNAHMLGANGARSVLGARRESFSRIELGR